MVIVCSATSNTALEHLTQDQQEDTLFFLERVASMAPAITTKWWKKFRHLTAKWRDQEILTDYVFPWFRFFRYSGVENPTVADGNKCL